MASECFWGRQYMKACVKMIRIGDVVPITPILVVPDLAKFGCDMSFRRLPRLLRFVTSLSAEIIFTR